MVTPTFYTVIIGLVIVERLIELTISRRNERIQLERGGIEYGASHYLPMVAIHTAFLAGCISETWVMERVFIPGLGFPMIVVLIMAQAMRYWVVMTLGRCWTVRVIVVPGDKRIETGPYQFLRHPNYVAVFAEGIALPLIHSNWITAIVFGAANIVWLTVRIRAENRALKLIE
jgi:methyltransferase